MSNYFADSFTSGFQSGQQSRENRKKREQDEKLQKARLDLELEQQARSIAAQKALQDADQTFRGGEGDKDRTFRTGERLGSETFQGGQADKDRTFRTGERVATQGFQGTQSELDRAARQMALDKELAQRAQLATAETAFKEKGLGWQMSPGNPGNKAQEAYAKMTLANLPPAMNEAGPQLSVVDQQALEWAKANPNDPRAAAILKKLTGR